MAGKPYSQKRYLFFSYGTLTVILLSVFFGFFYNYYRSNIYREAKGRSLDLTISVQSFVSGKLDNMSAVSMNAVYSKAIRSRFSRFAESYHTLDHPGNNMGPEETAQYMETADAIQDIYDYIMAIIGVYQSVSQVNLYTNNGHVVGSGYLERVMPVEIGEKQWYQQTVARNGYKFLSDTYISTELPAEGENWATRRFLSLTRVLKDSAGRPEGIVEVVQDCNKLFSLISELEDNSLSTEIYVFNDRNAVVYPYPENLSGDNLPDYLDEIERSGLDHTEADMVTLSDGTSVVLSYKPLEQYGWTVVTVMPEDAVYASLPSFRNLFLAILVFSVLIMLLVCFSISERMTSPLRNLTEAVSQVTLSRVLKNSRTPLFQVDSNVSEISRLCDSFREMYGKLQSSSKEVLLAHSEETKAKMQATQSLINPHFLYNSLTTISVLAEEAMDEEIIEICQSLCEYFRYISASQEMIVPLSQELFYSEKYINCMSIRFADEFQYHCWIDEETKNLLVPKLIVQPVIENVFKYAYHQAPPPWILEIRSYIRDKKWLIEIADNGCCLTDERKEQLLAQYAGLDQDKELKSMKIGGMGLKNVYLRLKLLYGDQAVFQIENKIPGRTVFILGGPIYGTEEAYDEQHPDF